MMHSFFMVRQEVLCMTEYWGETIRKNVLDRLAAGDDIFSTIPEEFRGKVAAKVELGFATGKPFHTFVPDKRGGTSVLSLTPTSGAINNYPVGEDAKKRIDKECARDPTWRKVVWVE